MYFGGRFILFDIKVGKMHGFRESLTRGVRVIITDITDYNYLFVLSIVCSH